MRPVSASLTIDAPRERVFELLIDLSARPAFTDHFMHRYQLLREEPVGRGAGARFELPAAGGWFDSVIQESDPPHRLIERGHGGRLNRVPAVTEWRLTGGARCELEVTFWTEPSGLAARIRDVRNSERKVARGWRVALERLRRLIEEDEPVRRVALAGATAAER